MSLHAVREVALHIGSFRNVDLFHQGVYHLEIRLFEVGGPEGHKNAVPHLLVPDNHSGHTDLLPASVLDGEAAFRSSSVFIRFCEEELDINNVALYRIECPVDSDPPLMLEVKLMFADHTRNSRVGSKDATPSTPSMMGASDFIRVSEQHLQLNNVLSGVHAYCPITFDEYHFCRVGLMAHSTLVDFRLRVPSGLPRGSAGRGNFFLLADALIKLARGIQRRQAKPESGTELPTAEAVAEQPTVTATKTSPSSGGEDLMMPLCSARTAGRVAAASTTLADAVSCIRNECFNRLVAAHSRLSSFLIDLSKHRRLTPDLLPNIKHVQLPAHQPPALAGQVAMSTKDTLSDDKTPIGWRPGWTVSPRQTDAIAAARWLAEDVSIVSAQILDVWQQLLQAVARSLPDVTVMLYADWDKKCSQFWSAGTYCRTIPGREIAHPNGKEVRLAHSHLATELRGLQHFRSLRPHVLEDLSLAVPAQEQHVIFEQRYEHTDDTAEEMLQGATASYSRGEVPRPPGAGSIPTHPPGCGVSPRCPPHEVTGSANSRSSRSYSPRANNPRTYLGIHVIVLVHGFQGQGFDMRLIKNTVSLLHPQGLYLLSTANEHDTEGDIEEMGERLAEEVRGFIKDWCPGVPPEPSLGRLSFIAHSAGGLIVRSALPLLSEYSRKMHTFMTFSTPHLGYMYAANPLFSAGLWVVKKFRKSACLEQLSMTDSPDKADAFLVHLSEKTGLEFFKHLVLVSSRQDQYVAFESARIEMSNAAERDPKFGQLYTKMVNNLLEPLDVERVIRLDVDFQLPLMNCDNMIGRTAHIQFIECTTLLRGLVQTHGFLFE
jgi:hypothetical protein